RWAPGCIAPKKRTMNNVVLRPTCIRSPFYSKVQFRSGEHGLSFTTTHGPTVLEQIFTHPPIIDKGNPLEPAAPVALRRLGAGQGAHAPLLPFRTALAHHPSATSVSILRKRSSVRSSCLRTAASDLPISSAISSTLKPLV